MEVFKEYASYYDLIYKEKDYESEATFIESLIKKYKPGAKTILNFGCGTGKHDMEFAERGYNVTGVELSTQMFDIAKKRSGPDNSKDNPKFINGDIRNVSIAGKFDVIISLFHVMSYLTIDEDVMAVINNARSHLSHDGIFIFDFWYGPGVLTQKPEIRTRKFENNGMSFTRTATPEMRVNNIVDINLEIVINKKQVKDITRINEIHSMRYFFLPEIKLFLDKAGMTELYNAEWMTGSDLTDQSWSGVIVCKSTD